MSERWVKASEVLMRLLRLRTWPVAVKLYRRGEEVPCDVVGPAEPITICQFVNIARVHGKPLLGRMRDIVCAYAQSFLGFADFPEDLVAGERQAGRRTEKAEVYERILRDMPRIAAGETEAVLVSPLNIARAVDVVLIFANPAQMTRLIHASTWKRGERITVRTAAEAGTCGEGIAATYLLRKPTIAFPCYGTRRFGLAADDELIFGVPAEAMDELLEGLEKTHAAMPYPIVRQVEVTPKPPSLYTIRREPPPT